MTSFRENPDSDEARILSGQIDREVFALQQMARHTWQCDLGDGKWDHDWQEKHDSAGGEGGSPSIEWSWRECRVCGEIEKPNKP